MNGNEQGFLTPAALAAVFSLSMLLLSLSMIVSAEERRILSYRNAVSMKKEAESLIYKIGEDMQILADFPSDADSSVAIQNIISSYTEYGLSMQDVSTGINRMLLKKEILESPQLKKYLALHDEGVFTDYGWINKTLSDKEVLEYVSDSFGTENPFPVVNAFPLYNVNLMDDDFLLAILSYSGIKQPEDKIRLIHGADFGYTGEEKLSEIFGVSRNHPVFSFLGTKTVFWQVDFETDCCAARAVFAAVPDEEAQQRIEKYILVEKSISYKRGEL